MALKFKFDTWFDEQLVEVIKEMPDKFSSHEFILAFAQKHQALYIDLLYSYREKDPFEIAHGRLAKHLNDFGDLIVSDGEVLSADIFGRSNKCASWRKKI